MSIANSVNIYVYEDSGRHTYTLEVVKMVGFQFDPIYFLDKIEEIVKNNLPYTPYPYDSSRQIAQEKASTLLPEIAKLAYENFITHHSPSTQPYRFNDWPQVRRFLNIFSPSLPFPQEIIKIIGQNLRFADLITYSEVNLKAYRESQAVFEELAISNGYTLCNQSFPFSISHIDYLKTLSFFKENVYDTHKNAGDSLRSVMIQCAKSDTIKHIFRWDNAVKFQSSLDISGDDSLFEKICNDKVCTLYDRAVFCSLAHTRSTALTFRQAFLLKRFEKNIKKALTAENATQ